MKKFLRVLFAVPLLALSALPAFAASQDIRVNIVFNDPGAPAQMDIQVMLAAPEYKILSAVQYLNATLGSPTNPGTNTFATVTEAANYYSGVYGTGIVNDLNTTLGLSGGAAYTLGSTVVNIDQITARGLSNLQTQINNITTRSFSTPTRSLNTVFQPSTTRDAFVSCSVDISSTLSLTAGQQGTVYLEYADDNGFTTNVKEVQRFVNGNTGTLTIGLGLTQNVTGGLTGMVPAAKYARLRTQNNTGTPTFTYRSCSEVLM